MGAHGGGWWVWQLVNGEEVVVGGGRDFGSKRVFVSFGFSSKKVFVQQEQNTKYTDHGRRPPPPPYECLREVNNPALNIAPRGRNLPLIFHFV